MHTLPRALRLIAILALLAYTFVPTVQAQIWQGPASLEIRAEGKGASVAGGSVELVYLALDPPAGPPPVPLDPSGRALINGLAEGRWRVSVSREGFMTYQAEVDVRRDDKPALIATFQQNVPGATHMMRVKIARAKPSGPAVPPPPPQIAERPAPTPPPAPATPPPAPAPTPAPEQPAPPAQEAPMSHATPMMKPPQPEAPAVETPATPPPPAAPVPSQPAPQPQPAPAPAQPAPAPQPPPGGSVLHRSYVDRTCYECKPGESSLSVEKVLDAGVGCGAGVRDMLAQSGDAASLPAGCAILRVTLPAGARYTGYRYEVQDRTGSVDCMAGRNCPGGGRWPVDPVLVKATSGTTISAAFENAGAGGDRRALLTVYYTER